MKEVSLIIDYEAGKLAAVAIEKHMDDQGWDGDPCVFWLYHESVNDDLDGLAVIESEAQPLRFSSNGVDGLAAIAAVWASGGAEILGDVPGERLNEFAGIAFCHQDWHSESWTGGDSPHQGIADMPDAVECRTVAFLDCSGRINMCQRDRGADFVHTGFVLKEPDRKATIIEASLAIQLASIMRNAPAAAWDREGVMSWLEDAPASILAAFEK